MIFPYRKEDFENKSLKELLDDIQDFKNEIRDLKKDIEDPLMVSDIICPSLESILYVKRSGLTIAKSILKKHNYNYIPSNEELISEEFNNHLDNLERIIFEYTDYTEGRKKYQLSFYGDNIIIIDLLNNNKLINTKYSFKGLESRKDLIQYLKEAYIGEWSNFYIYKSDEQNETWFLELHFSDGYKSKIVKGINKKPFSYDNIYTLFFNYIK